MATTHIPCIHCGAGARKFGKDKLGNQRFHCDSCGKTFIPNKKTFRIERSKAIRCLRLLVEGVSIRSIERLEEVHRETILHLLTVVGERCKKLLEEKVINVPVSYVEADEIWGF